MENKKEYLSEERYQKSNAKIKKIGKILLIIGGILLVIGFTLKIIGFLGVGKSGNNIVNNFVDDFNSTSSNIIDDFNSFDVEDEDEETGIDIDFSGFQNTASGIFSNFSLLAISGFISSTGFVLVIVGGVILIIAHRREIKAYTIQQTMPIAQEGMEKIAPSVGTIGKELAKGIKEGINEADKNK